MKLRTKLIIAGLALGFAMFGVLGNDLFVAMGFPPGSGRAVVAISLSILGIAWFVWSGFRMRLGDLRSNAGAKRHDDKKTTRS